MVLLTRPEQPEPPELLVEKSVASSPMDGAVANYAADKMGLTLLTGTPIIGRWLALSMKSSFGAPLRKDQKQKMARFPQFVTAGPMNGNVYVNWDFHQAHHHYTKARAAARLRYRPD